MFHEQGRVADGPFRLIAVLFLQQDTEYDMSINAVHVGDSIAMMKGIGTGCDSLCYQLESGYKELLLCIRKDQLQAIMIRVDEDFQRMKAFVNGGAGNA